MPGRFGGLGYRGDGIPARTSYWITGAAPVAAPALGTHRTAMQKILIKFVRGYRYLVSPLLGNRCRFYPSCSTYAEDALAAHGAWRGSWLAIRRLARCHPWHAGGHD